VFALMIFGFGVVPDHMGTRRAGRDGVGEAVPAETVDPRLAPLKADTTEYPKGTMEKYTFSQKPLSVVTGEFSIATKFKVPANAPSGATAQNGTLRYQACNDRMCFAPKSVPVSITLEIE
jgi:hypothetical protein